jgi:multiple sugar transport system permease protein
MALRRNAADAAARMSPTPITGARRHAWAVRLGPYLLVGPALLLVLGILYPFVLAIWYSLTNYNLIFPLVKFVGLKNYGFVFTSPDFWHASSVTFGYAVAAVVVELLLGLVTALLLNRDTPLAQVLRRILVLPLMIAPVLGTLIWKLMMNPSFGVANWLLSPFGLRNFTWGDSPNTALFTVVLIDVWIFTPFFALLLLAGLRGIDHSLYEAAQVDGAHAWDTFCAVIWPLILPYVIVSVLFRLVDSLRAFDIIFALTKGGPGNTLWNYQVTAYYQSITFSNIGLGAAYMVVNWVIIYLISQGLVAWWNAARRSVA